MLPDPIRKILDRDEIRPSFVTKRLAQSARALLHPRMPHSVIFVGGVQRSGTNMLMSVLERSFETAVFHETDPRAYDDFVMLPAPVVHRLVAASSAPCVVLKALCELQQLTYLLDEFAPAKALWIVRNYDDMVNSHLRSWKGCSVTMGRIVADRYSMKWRGRGMSDATHAAVSQLYHPDINDDSAVALFWYLRNVLFFEQKLESDRRMLPLSYESLVLGPDEELSRTFAFLGLNYPRRVAAGLHARSVRKHAPPEIEAPIRQLCDGLMARFEPVLQRGRAGVAGRAGPAAPTAASPISPAPRRSA